MPIRITGLNSGLDTEAIISALVSSYSYKTDKYKKAQTKLSWKQDAWKALNTKIYSLYTNIGNLRLSSAYNLKSTTVSDTTKATVSASSSAPNGTQKLNIIEVAQAGYLTGAKLDDSTTTGTTLAELGYTGGDGQINLTKGDGTTTSISVTQGTTVASFLASLKEADVSANYDEVNKRIFVSSKATGADNDFTLTGANLDGVKALYSLGLNVGSAATDATYSSYAKYYYDGYDVAAGVAAGNITDNVEGALADYVSAKEAYEKAEAANTNLTAAYSYATAYSAMMDALQNSGLSDTEQKKLQTLLGMTATERVNSVMDASGNVYTEAGKDADGNTIYSCDEGTSATYIQRVVTYSDASGNVYTLNDDGTLTYGDKTYTATAEKDGDNTVYTDADGNKVTIKTETAYYTAEANTGATALSDVKRSTDALTELKEDSAFSLTEDDVNTLTTNIGTVNAFEAVEDTVLKGTDPGVNEYTRAEIATAVKDAYANNGGAAGVTALTNTFAQTIAANKTAMTTAEETMEEHEVLAELAAIDKRTAEGATEYATALSEFVAKVQNAHTITGTTDPTDPNYVPSNDGAKKIDGTDSKITLNGIEYTSSLNTYSINGLSITAQQATGEGDTNAISITTATDTQGIYDKIKDFLTQYNALVNEMTSLYNADTAKGYEPLTDEEKDALSETEVEKWEEKIKASLLRRDDSLESVLNAMTTSMSRGYEINGKKYYLSSFGIKTLGYFNAPENQQYAYHIDGDEDDASTSGNTDKLMAMINSDPDTVVSFLQQLTSDLYNAVGDKMKSTTLSSTYTVYNDKEMASEYSDYTDIIKKWEEKLAAQEDYYYNKFSAMETALSKLNSQTSSLSSMLGG